MAVNPTIPEELQTTRVTARIGLTRMPKLKSKMNVKISRLLLKRRWTKLRKRQLL
jgi:hypothetical protein